jgi:hypothetical protein
LTRKLSVSLCVFVRRSPGSIHFATTAEDMAKNKISSVPMKVWVGGRSPEECRFPFYRMTLVTITGNLVIDGGMSRGSRLRRLQ